MFEVQCEVQISTEICRSGDGFAFLAKENKVIGHFVLKRTESLDRSFSLFSFPSRISHSTIFFVEAARMCSGG